jgi:transposase
LDEILPFRADYYPVLGQLMNEIDLAGTINRVVNIQASQANIDVGTFVGLIIHHMLGDVNIKMYSMHEFFEDKALPLLVPWKPDMDISEINDDRAARVLDAVWNADPQKVFSAVVNEAISVHSLETDVIHGDTTSKSFHGAYDEQSEEIGAPLITYGHPKDHRPDLKQIIFGVGTTADGVPVIGEVAKGNEADMTLNGRWMQSLRSILKKDKDEFLLYIADSAAVTTDNLDIRAGENIDIISRLPGRFNIEKGLKRAAILKNDWEDIGKLSDEKKAASYKVWDTTEEIEGRTYRFVVVHSDNKDKRKLKPLDKAVKRESDIVKKRLKKLSKRPFACEKDAKIEIEKFLEKHPLRLHQIQWKIEPREEKVKRKKRGRPKKGESNKVCTNYYLSGSFKDDKKAYDLERELCGQFVLLTTLMDTEKYPAKIILERYKGQGNVERIFRFIKNPSWVGSFCLKKNERIAALGYILLIAAVIYTLWERKVRKSLAKDGVEPIEGLNKQKTKRPTTYALQVVLKPILVLSQRVGDKFRIWLPKPLTPNKKRVLELSGFTVDIYQGEWRIKEKRRREMVGGCEI